MKIFSFESFFFALSNIEGIAKRQYKIFRLRVRLREKVHCKYSLQINFLNRNFASCQFQSLIRNLFHSSKLLSFFVSRFRCFPPLHHKKEKKIKQCETKRGIKSNKNFMAFARDKTLKHIFKCFSVKLS